MRVTVIGCGRWGSFLAWYASRCGHEVMLYGRKGSKKLEELRQTRGNGLLTLEDGVLLTDELGEAAAFGEILVVSVGAQNLRTMFGELAAFPLNGKAMALCMKGLEAATGKRLTEVAAESLPANCAVGIWVGPGHVQDFMDGIPNCMVIDSACEETKNRLIEAFSGDLIRFYYGNDLIGNEIGAAAKNVIGIAAGMLDGLHKGSLKGALMSRGTREIARLIAAMGGNEITAYGLSHLGDYEATVFSRHSHNRHFGEAFIKGEPYGELAEGVATTTALLRLSEQCGVELPICACVDAVVNGGQDPETVLGDLFLRSLKKEF